MARPNLFNLAELAGNQTHAFEFENDLMGAIIHINIFGFHADFWINRNIIWIRNSCEILDFSWGFNSNKILLFFRNILLIFRMILFESLFLLL